MSIPVFKVPVINVTTEPFDLFLVALGLRMQQLSKTNRAFKGLIQDRSFVLQLESQEGVARHYKINQGQVCHHSGKAAQPDFVLRFKDNQTALKTLTKGDPTAFMTGMQTGAIQIEGDFSLLMWFTQAAKLIAPKIPKSVTTKVKQAQRFIHNKRAALGR